MLMQETEGVIKYQLQHRFSAPDSSWNIAEINTWRTLLYRLQLIGQQAGRYMGYGYGNISQRMSGEQFIISGTQTGGIAELAIENYCLVEAADLSNNTLYSSGPCHPSSEALSHASVYRQDKGIGCVIHAHSPEIWQATKVLALPCTATDVAYGTPDMAQAIQQLFHSGHLSRQAIFTMLGHEDGVIAFGQNFQQAGNAMINTLARSMQLKSS